MIHAGRMVVAKRQLNYTIAEDEEPLLVIKQGDRLLARSDLNQQNTAEFIHLNTQLENIWLHRDDVEVA